jgi:hypothetical protein
VNKGFDISQKYAGSENWFRPHIFWTREHELRRTGQRTFLFPKLDRPILLGLSGHLASSVLTYC